MTPPPTAPTGLTRSLTELRVALRHAMAREAGWPAAAVAIGDGHAFLQAIDRHRLALCLAPHCQSLGLRPELAAKLQQAARREQLAALPLIAAALEALRALEEAGLRVLLFKGLALALQTTGQATGRGGGDIDLLVAPRDLSLAVAALEQIGFVSPAGLFPRRLESFWGRYSRWAGYELSLVRHGLWLDLHWALSNVRAPLPNFEIAWRERQILPLNGRPIATLSPRHALLHSCVHAAKDQWMSLRSLVDIHRLERLVPERDIAQLRRVRCVRLSTAVIAGITGSGQLRYWRAQRVALAAQIRPQPHLCSGPWHPWQWLGLVLRRASLSPSPIDWLRTLAYYTLLPKAFNDPATGLDVGFFGMMRARWQRLREHRGDL